MAKKFGLDKKLGYETKKTAEIASKGDEQIGIGRLETPSIEDVVLDPENARKTKLTVDDVLYLKDHPEDAESYLGNDAERIHRYQRVLELAKSIDDKGLIDPIAVYEKGDKYHLTGGENRYLAHLHLGKKFIPSLVKDLPDDDIDRMTRGLVHNIIRSQLKTAEKLQKIKEIVDKYEEVEASKITAPKLHDLIHESVDSCEKYLKYLRAGDHVMAAISGGVLNTHREIQAVLDAGDIDAQKAYIKQLEDGVQVGQGDSKDIPKTHIEKTQPKRGRKATKVKLGVIAKDDTSILQGIIKKVVGPARFKEEFGKIDWDDLENTQAAWDAFIASLKGAGNA